MPRSVDSNAATGEAVEEASAVKPGGGANTVSRWDIQQVCSRGVPASSRPVLADRQLGAAELAHLGALDPAAELARQQLHPVTDAEHRDARARAARDRAAARRRRRPTRDRRRGSRPSAGGAPPRRAPTWWGSSSENTPHSRTRRAISCEY